MLLCVSIHNENAGQPLISGFLLIHATNTVELRWYGHGTDQTIADGIYFCKLRAGDVRETRKLVTQ